MTPLWMALAAPVLSAIIAGAVAAAVATYQVRANLSNSTQLALKTFELEQRRARERAAEDARTVVSTFAHELHQPLSSIAAFADLLRDEDLEAPTRNDAIRRIQGLLDRLAGPLAACHKEVWTRQVALGPQVNQAFYQMLDCYNRLNERVQGVEAQNSVNLSETHLTSFAASLIDATKEMLDCTYRMIAPTEPEPAAPMTERDRAVSARFAGRPELADRDTANLNDN